MTPEEINIAIAEVRGWVWYKLPPRKDETRAYRCLFLPALHEFDGQSLQWLVRADGSERICNFEYMKREGHVQDCYNDLNAMNEAEKELDTEQKDAYCIELIDAYGDRAVFASATQRAEAFLRTLGKWKD
jgi:hypothetical protein